MTVPTHAGREIQCDWPRPMAVQLRGSRIARLLLRLAGWRVLFEGLPERQGVLAVYPHTSNWDFPVMLLAKWTVGIQVSFWGKDKLFRIPLFGRWMRWLGGQPVDRTSPRGAVGEAVEIIRREKAAGRFFWLGLAPEGTRKRTAGWRTGFYRTAHGADVPLCVLRLDYGRREVVVLDFIRLTGDEAADMRRIAGIVAGVRGKRPGNAAPPQILDPSVSRADTIVR